MAKTITNSSIPEAPGCSSDSQDSIIQVRNLRKWFNVKSAFRLAGKDVFGKTSWLKAVDDVSFDIKYGKTFGLVGESGCGKSTLAKIIVQLETLTSGEINYKNNILNNLSYSDLIKYKKDIQLVFQDPYSSLNPRLNIHKILEEPLIIHSSFNKNQRMQKCKEMIKLVGLQEQTLSKYPHEFSGGQRQRIVIARALILQPKLIIADEPVSALDVSIQSQILNLIKDIKDQLHLSLIFISHDLSVVSYMSDRIIVMYQGEIVEMGNAKNIFNQPQHQYTKNLISSIPKIKRY